MTIEAATTVVQTAGKARLPSSIAMLVVVLGLFLIYVGFTGAERLKMHTTTGVVVGAAGT